MKIKVDLFFFVAIIFFFISKKIEIYLLTMFFIILHEIGHLVLALIFKNKVNEIKVFFLGCSIKINKLSDLNIERNQKEIINDLLIFLAGPFINILIIIFSYMYKLDTRIIYINLSILLFNLIPIYPLDGGRIIRDIINLFQKNTKSNFYISKISYYFLIFLTILSSFFILIFKNIIIFFIICLLWSIIVNENKRYRFFKVLKKEIYKIYT